MYTIVVTDISQTDDFIELKVSYDVFNSIYGILYDLFKRELPNDLFNRVVAMAEGMDMLNLVDIPSNVFNQAAKLLKNYQDLILLMKQDDRYNGQ